jgi:hypothetical protein
MLKLIEFKGEVKMYMISKTVELGHSIYTGGSIRIGLEFVDVISDTDKELYLKLIDSLDHTIITTDESIKQQSRRYFLLMYSSNIFYDICHVITGLLKDLDISNDEQFRIHIQYGDETYIGVMGLDSHLISYNIEG